MTMSCPQSRSCHGLGGVALAFRNDGLFLPQSVSLGSRWPRTKQAFQGSLGFSTCLLWKGQQWEQFSSYEMAPKCPWSPALKQNASDCSELGCLLYRQNFKRLSRERELGEQKRQFPAWPSPGYKTIRAYRPRKAAECFLTQPFFKCVAFTASWTNRGWSCF